ncbi:DUF1659 domain-containing protein [Cytobacillus sp. Hz8]|uniref:DUF1659 domain-containing protein n=1 Tax=Cytobacillus sp. Hz8 TaxID=3347168 RepID=UPI0035DA01D4
MAEAMIMDTKLRLVFDGGMDEKGDPIYKSKTYSNIKKDVTTDQLSQAGKALASLSGNTLVGIERNDNFEIVG